MTGGLSTVGRDEGGASEEQHVASRSECRALTSELTDYIAKNLHLVDGGLVVCMLASYVAMKKAHQQPPWIMTVGPSGAGKSTTATLLAGLPDMHTISTMTEAGLRKQSRRGKEEAQTEGGLMTLLGNEGGLILKDFNTLRTTGSAQRNPVQSALREIYDGDYGKAIAGEHSRFKGRFLVLACTVPQIFRDLSKDAELGERFLYVRTKGTFGEEDICQDQVELETRLKQCSDLIYELYQKVAHSVASQRPDIDSHLFFCLAELIVYGRTYLRRDGKHELVDADPDMEIPSRVARQLVALQVGLHFLGMTKRESFSLMMRFFIDGIPKERARVLQYLMEHPASVLKRIGTDLSIGERPLRTTLGDLQALGMVETAKGAGRRPDLYDLSEGTKRSLSDLQNHITSNDDELDTQTRDLIDQATSRPSSPAPMEPTTKKSGRSDLALQRESPSDRGMETDKLHRLLHASRKGAGGLRHVVGPGTGYPRFTGFADIGGEEMAVFEFLSEQDEPSE